MLAVTACCVLRAGALYIALQAARRRESHFNRETSLESMLYYGAMGGGALVILAGSALVGMLLWRRVRARPPSGAAYGMRSGRAWPRITAVAGTAVVAFTLVQAISGRPFLVP